MVEVHDQVGEQRGRVKKVHELLAMRGYEVHVEEDTAIRGTGLYNVYALSPQRRRSAKSELGRYPTESTPSVGLVTTPGLRAYLSEKLPEYMVPSFFVLLDQLPLTPSGKLDRSALPDPHDRNIGARAIYVPPRTETQRIVAAIWKEVLQIEKIGMNDNFFDLGGHSLLLVRVNSKIRQTFGCDLPLVEMFKHSTVSSLAGRIGSQKSSLPLLEYSFDRAKLRKESLKKHSRPRVFVTRAPRGER